MYLCLYSFLSVFLVCILVYVKYSYLFSFNIRKMDYIQLLRLWHVFVKVYQFSYSYQIFHDTIFYICTEGRLTRLIKRLSDYASRGKAIRVVGKVVVLSTRSVDIVLIVRGARVRVTKPPIDGRCRRRSICSKICLYPRCVVWINFRECTACISARTKYLVVR